MLDITSSIIVSKALGLQPQGVPAESNCVCAMCGLTIKKGDLTAPLSLGPAFMDDLYMAARGSQNVCGHCVNVMTAQGLRDTQAGVYSASGVRPFRKWADILEALKNPPESPFVMLFATANNQHMAWRAPVNYSQDVLRVRVGLRDLTIRKDYLEKAFNAAIALGNALNDDRDSRNSSGKKDKAKKASTRKTLPNPFLKLASDLKDPMHGRLNPHTERVAIQYGLQNELAIVKGATLGETWALLFYLTPDAGKKAE